MSWEIREGNCLDLLADMPDGSVQTCITSPPYWGLRDYGEEDQLGLEPTPEAYVENIVAVFREVRRVLRDDGTLWLNLGDSYCSTAPGTTNASERIAGSGGRDGVRGMARAQTPSGLKPKDLVGIPWRVAFALQADGWYLRSDIIWHKPNPMPESVTDRPTKAHEYIFLMTKQPKYFYDAYAIREDGVIPAGTKGAKGSAERQAQPGVNARPPEYKVYSGKRNKRTVWTVATKPFSGAHFAVFPPELIEPCVLAGSSPKACGECGAPWRRIVKRVVPSDPGRGESKLRDADGLSARAASTAKRQLGGNYQKQLNENPPETVGWESTCEHDDDSASSVILDPFSGAGTTGLVALRNQRSYVGLELNPEYANLSRNRIREDAPLLNATMEAVG